MLHADPIARSLAGWAIFVFFVAQTLSSIFFFIYGIRQDAKDAVNQGKDATGSRILNRHLREWYFEKLRAFEDFFIRNKFRPNTLTMIGCSFSVVAAVFYHLHWIGAAGWLVLVSGTFDIFDGAIARKTNQVSKSGAFFDSVLDRYAEMIVYGGILSHYLRSGGGQVWMIWVVLAAMVGAQMVSYTRARAENAGVKGKLGLMQRPERFVYLGFGSLFSSHLSAAFAPWITAPQWLLAVTILFIAIMSNLTAYRRFQSAFEELKAL